MINRYSGDPRLIIDEQGTTIKYSGGQPVMDAGIENALLLSLLVENGWCGNILFDSENEKLGSDYASNNQDPITLSTINKKTSEAKNALNWLIDAGVASEISVKIKNPYYNRIDTEINIKYPGGNMDKFIISKYAENWLMQRDDPAYRKI